MTARTRRVLSLIVHLMYQKSILSVRTLLTLYRSESELIIVFGCGASRLRLVEVFVLPRVFYMCCPLFGGLVCDAGPDGVGGSSCDVELSIRLPLIFGVWPRRGPATAVV